MLVTFGASGSYGVPEKIEQDQASTKIPAQLYAQATEAPNKVFRVIVQGDGTAGADKVAKKVARYAAEADEALYGEYVETARDARDARKNADKAAHAAQLSKKQAIRSTEQAKALPKAKDAGSRKSVLNAAAKASKDAAEALEAQADAASALVTQAQAEAAAVEPTEAFFSHEDRIQRTQITDEFSSISGVEVNLTGDQILSLGDDEREGLLAITPNAPVETSGDARLSSDQLWPFESGVAKNWSQDTKVTANMPAIAIVDSGIQNRPEFGARLVASVNLSSLPNNSAGDGRGHGTFVAGLAASSAERSAGASPFAKLVSIDVLDDTGMGLTGDIIRACQWILENKDKYNIRVANFSLHSSITAPFYIDPLNRAVEQLWHNGIVVVAAAGNYGTGGAPSGVNYSPGSDPFVITVGAADIGGTAKPKDDSVASWSAWGHTIDGFAKPEISAPGRFMVGPVPMTSTLVAQRPGNLAGVGYMQLSGTSFSAPIVSGTAASILARNPSWTPAQVKGALMLTARPLEMAVGHSGGVGQITANKAAELTSPPNPNLALDAFVGTDAVSGAKVFDSASWNSAVQLDASWNSASWNSASWNSASWNSASWNSASWNSASWNSASWNDASWNSASWNSASWNSASYEDAGESDPAADEATYTIDPLDLAELLADPDLAPEAESLPDWLAVPVLPTPTTTTVETTTTTVQSPLPTLTLG